MPEQIALATLPAASCDSQGAAGVTLTAEDVQGLRRVVEFVDRVAPLLEEAEPAIKTLIEKVPSIVETIEPTIKKLQKNPLLKSFI